MNAYVDYSDERLISLLREGDQTAFEQVYNRYWKQLLFYVSGKINHYHDAQEIVQEVFLEIWKRRENLELKHSLSTYLHAAVKYKVISYFSAKHKISARLSDLQVPEFTEQVSTIDFNELLSQVAAIVDALPDKCQLVFRLSREKEYGHRQIAAELGIAEKTVQAHITLALNKIRAGLGSFWLFCCFTVIFGF